jgi:hypothetical protein
MINPFLSLHILQYISSTTCHIHTISIIQTIAHEVEDEIDWSDGPLGTPSPERSESPVRRACLMLEAMEQDVVLYHSSDEANKTSGPDSE